MLSSELFWKRGEYQVICPTEEETEAISEWKFWTCGRKAVSPHVPEPLLLPKEVKVKDVGMCRFKQDFRRITVLAIQWGPNS